MCKLCEAGVSHDEGPDDYLQLGAFAKTRSANHVKSITNDGSAATKYLILVFGQNTRRDITRWLLAAGQVPASALDILDQRVLEKGTNHNVKANFVFRNNLVSPPVAQSKTSLSEEWMVAAFVALFGVLDSGATMTAQMFVDRICQPFRLFQGFCGAQHKEYGAEMCSGFAWEILAADLK